MVEELDKEIDKLLGDVTEIEDYKKEDGILYNKHYAEVFLRLYKISEKGNRFNISEIASLIGESYQETKFLMEKFKPLNINRLVKTQGRYTVMIIKAQFTKDNLKKAIKTMKRGR